MAIVTIQSNRINREEDTFLNPKQELFLKNYLDPKSDTFGNCTQSGLKAGFSESYSKMLMQMMPAWLEETVGDARRLRLAEDNITELLTQGEDLKVKADMTKFVSSTLGRKKYSTRTETDVTSKGESILGINYIVPGEVGQAKVVTEEHITEAEIKLEPIPEEVKEELPKEEIIPAENANNAQTITDPA